MARALAGDDIERELMHFLNTPRGAAIESEVFVSLPERGYGTRASTIVIACGTGSPARHDGLENPSHIDFVEQTFDVTGVPAGAAARFRLR